MRGFFDSQTAKESQLHDPRLVGIPCGEPLERRIDGKDLRRDRIR
jgi:hypothetical protein